jgi:hypothetical protein
MDVLIDVYILCQGNFPPFYIKQCPSMASLLSSLWSGSSESCVASSHGDRLSAATGQISDSEWLEQKRANFVKLLRELGEVDERIMPWADRAEAASLTSFLVYMRLENPDVAAAASPEEAAAAALRAVDRAVLLLEADADAPEFKSKRNKLARYIILFSQ